MKDFEPLFEFEKRVAEYFNAPYAVATDCCTHALEMCLQLSSQKKFACPTRTYISVPFMLEKIKADYFWLNVSWREFYLMTRDVADAATYWKKNGYLPKTKMCLSFGMKKHINIGKGGMILLDNEAEYERLKKMRYDGRSIYDGVLYKDDDIKEIGYHYYMTPEIAKIGLQIFKTKKDQPAKIISSEDYERVDKFSVFNGMN